MSLQDTLFKMKEEFEVQAPADALQVIKQSTEDLIASGIIKNVIKTGEKAPEFSLTDEKGNIVTSTDLLNNGPLVVSFYRGTW